MTVARRRSIFRLSPGLLRAFWGLAVAGCLGLLFGVGLTDAPAQLRDKYFEERNRMVSESLVKEGIKNQAVLKSMATVPRHMFVAANMRHQAYYDQAIAIGHKQTISPPYIVAYMTEMLDPQPDDRVLEIGTGSGYQAAILSKIVKEVYTIEIVDALGKNAARVLKDLKLDNVHPKIGDGYLGWLEKAPFDKIIVTCSPESVPQPLTDQLKEGGKMIVPLGTRYEQRFYMFEKKDGKLVKSSLLPALFVPMTAEAEKHRKIQPDPKHPTINNGGFEIDDDDDGHPNGWHYQRQMSLESKGAPEGKNYVKFSNETPGRGAQMLQGMGMDGQAVPNIEISLKVRANNIRGEVNEQASFIIQFYNSNRDPMDVVMIGPWEGTFDWKTYSKKIAVPSKAREAIVRVGLNGATGDLSVDDIQLTAKPK